MSSRPAIAGRVPLAAPLAHRELFLVGGLPPSPEPAEFERTPVVMPVRHQANARCTGRRTRRSIKSAAGNPPGVLIPSSTGSQVFVQSGESRAAQPWDAVERSLARIQVASSSSEIRPSFVDGNKRTALVGHSTPRRARTTSSTGRATAWPPMTTNSAPASANSISRSRKSSARSIARAVPGRSGRASRNVRSAATGGRSTTKPRA